MTETISIKDVQEGDVISLSKSKSKKKAWRIDHITQNVVGDYVLWVHSYSGANYNETFTIAQTADVVVWK